MYHVTVSGQNVSRKYSGFSENLARACALTRLVLDRDHLKRSLFRRLSGEEGGTLKGDRSDTGKI